MESRPEWRVSAAQFWIQDMCEGQSRTKAFTLEPLGHDLIGKAGTPLWTPDSEPLALTLALCLDLNLTSQFLFPDFIRPLIHSFIHSFIQVPHNTRGCGIKKDLEAIEDTAISVIKEMTVCVLFWLFSSCSM